MYKIETGTDEWILQCIYSGTCVDVISTVMSCSAPENMYFHLQKHTKTSHNMPRCFIK